MIDVIYFKIYVKCSVGGSVLHRKIGLEKARKIG